MEAPVKHPIEPGNNPSVAHEHTDADTRAITRFGIALAFAVIIVQVFLWWMFDHLSSREAKLSPPVPALITAQAPTEPPAPRLQGDPQLDMRKLREAEDAVLNHYGWVDPDRGIVRIPIERAIDLIAQRGLPDFKTQAKRQR
jgi:hypothetical protein